MSSSPRDWKALKREWLTLKWRNLEEFARAKKLPYRAVRRASMKEGWLKQRAEVEQAADKKVKEDTSESLAQRIKKIKKENFDAATKIMNAGTKKSDEKGVNSPEQAVKIGMDGRLQSVDQATETTRIEFELTEEDRAKATAIGISLARLKKNKHK